MCTDFSFFPLSMCSLNSKNKNMYVVDLISVHIGLQVFQIGRAHV